MRSPAVCWSDGPVGPPVELRGGAFRIGDRLFWRFAAELHQDPRITMMAEAEQDIYTAWRRRAITIGSLMAACALGFVGLSFLLGAQLRRRIGT